MIGAIIGDIVGSRFEFNNHRDKDFELFTDECCVTDDSIMTLAVAKAIMETQRIRKPPNLGYDCDGDYYLLLGEMTIEYLQEIGRRYPNCGYGGMFSRWVFSDEPKPYNSFGNGAAMRISPVGFVAKTKNEVSSLSKAVTGVTHDHEEGIKGAQVTAMAVYMARQGFTKTDIQNEVVTNYYPLDFTLDEIRDSYRFNETCQDTVPQAIKAFLEATSFEDAIRNAISIGGDSDTLAAITGAIAEAYYGVPVSIKEKALQYLDDELLALYQDWSEFLGQDGEIGKFHVLTKYIDRISEEESYGEWSADGTSENSCQMPFVQYSDLVKAFVVEFQQFAYAHPEYGLRRYNSILVNKGLDCADCSMRKADADTRDEQCVLALIMGAIQAEQFNDGALLSFLRDGYIVKWLTRLKTIDEADTAIGK